MDGMIGETIIVPPDANLNFESASEFKKVLSWGAEIQFDWKGHSYGVIRYGTNNKITAYEIYKPETEKCTKRLTMRSNLCSAKINCVMS